MKKDKNDIKKFLVQSSRTKYLRHRTHALYTKTSFRQSAQALPEFIRMCPWETETFLKLFMCYARKGVVEIGRFTGGSTLVMGMANEAIPIFSIDISPRDDKALRDILDANGIGDNIELITADSRKISSIHGRSFENTFDFLFIDGDHSRAGCLADINAWWPRLSPGGMMVLHDCYASHTYESAEALQGVLEATMSFLQENQCTIIIPPTFHSRPWEKETGSIFAAIKPLT